MVKYNKGHRSKNVEYRGPARRSRGGFGLPTGGRRGGGLPLPLPTGRGGKAGAGGIGGIIIMVVVLFASGAFSGGGGGTAGLSTGAGSSGDAPERNAFMEFIFDDVQETWDGIFRDAGQRYPASTMVIFSQSVETGGCGGATSAVGPFYCPADSMVYLDTDFFADLANRFGAPGDFAQAYVVAHEVGHHVQNVLGTSDQVRNLKQSDPRNANEYSIALELQADCYAGVWGNSAAERGLLERGDLEEGLGAAAAVGDDRIQESAGAQVNPETWTHGSSEQRIEWFRIGFDSGDEDSCDTFASLT